MVAQAMPDSERQELLRALQGLASDADQHDRVVRVFLPLPIHDLALRSETMVVRGERGAGKTALFHFVQQLQEGDQLRKVFTQARVPQGTWLEGYSESSTAHPSTQVLEAFAKTHSAPEWLDAFWRVHLSCVVATHDKTPEQIPPEVFDPWRERRNEPEAWVAPALQHIGRLTDFLDHRDATQQSGDFYTFVTYDHLDRIAPADRVTRIRYASSLLSLWLSLTNRYRNLRPKVFLREDLFEATQAAFPDASKLKARSVSLDWNIQGLYRLLVRQMAELSEGLRVWLQRGGAKVSLRYDDLLGWLPPDPFKETGKESQKGFIDHLAGEKIERGQKKGYTYRWIPNRLQDAHARIVPRSLLTLVQNAADDALRKGPAAGYDRLLAPRELQAALEETSRRRVAELQEEHPLVLRLSNLRGANVLIEPNVARRLLGRPSSVDDGLEQDGDAVMTELVRLGVLSIRSDGRIDVPDIYRYAYGIKRKGGMSRPH